MHPDGEPPVTTVPKAGASTIAVAAVASLLLVSAWWGVQARASICPGDCDGDGAVAISELVTCVNAALGKATECTACDVDGNGVVVINELVAAVTAALAQCPPTPSPSPTATDTLPTATASPTAIPSSTRADSPTASPTPTASASATAADTSSPSSTPRNSATATPTRTPRPPTRTATASPTFRITATADVVRAAAEVSVQNLATVQVIALVCTSAGGCQTGAKTGAMSVWNGTGLQAPDALPRGVPEACADGGTKLVTCTNGVRTVVFTDCVEPGTAGSTNARSGTVVLTVADPGFCDDLVIDPLKSVALELQGYRHVERDAQGAEVARLEGDWRETLTPTSGGCRLASAATQLADGFHEVSGTLHAECGAGSQALPCPRGSLNLTLRTNGLQMLRQSAGSPCELTLQMIGTVAVDALDRSLDGRSCRMEFTQTFTNFLFVQAPVGDGTSTVRQSGRMTVEQFGPLDLATGPPGGAGFLFVNGDDCPTGGDGALEVRRPEESSHDTAPTVRFQHNGNGDPQVVFDFTGGDVETVTGCVGISPLTTCQ